MGSSVGPRHLEMPTTLPAKPQTLPLILLHCLSFPTKTAIRDCGGWAERHMPLEPGVHARHTATLDPQTHGEARALSVLTSIRRGDGGSVGVPIFQRSSLFFLFNKGTC